MISASVVIYNTLLEDFIKMLSSYNPGPERRLYIIDNSVSETVYCREMQNEYITYLFSGKNLGYGAAHNWGIRRAIQDKSEYHVVLNPDVSFETTVIDELKEYADEHNDIVYVLPKVLYPSGEIQYLCKLLPTPFDLIFRRFLPQIGIFKKMNDRYTLKKSGYDKIINPPCLSGCFMFMRTAVLRDKQIFFDERFFMYCEDFDLIRRLHQVGKTIFYPEVTIVHDHKKESYRNKRMLKQHMKSAFKYFNKYGWFFDKERKEQNCKILEEIISM